MIEHIEANAEIAIQQLRPLSGIDFGYTRASVEWLEGYIERLRLAGEFEVEAVSDKLISVFGSFLGQCVVRCYGGAWAEQEGQWCVAFDARNCVFPFAKVSKQMEHGLEDGIGGFFRIIPEVFAAHLHPAAPLTRKPWWKFW